MKDEKPTCEQSIIEQVNKINVDSERMTLRKFSHNEIDSNVEHEMDPDLMRYIRDPLSKEKTKKRTLDRAIDWNGQELDWALIALRHKESNEYMGLVCMRYESIENDTLEIGWRLDHKYHGKGYATEAANSLLDFIKSEIKPHKVMAYCIAENIASSNIMTKLGMEQEAHFKQYCKLGGQWQDEVVYGLILN